MTQKLLSPLRITALLLIIISISIGLKFYAQMPEKIASHWNYAGEADGYTSRFWGLAIMPIISTILFVLFITLPNLDPMKQNVDKFRKYYDGFILVMIAFMFYLFTLVVLWNVNYKFSMNSAIAPAFAVLFFYIGILLENSKQNWFIGIRNPWTLSSQKVWDKTHKLGGILFKIAAVIALIGLFLPKHSLLFVLIPIIAVSLFLIIYSYFEFKKN